jgi:hypothetical protein
MSKVKGHEIAIKAGLDETTQRDRCVFCPQSGRILAASAETRAISLEKPWPMRLNKRQESEKMDSNIQHPFLIYF